MDQQRLGASPAAAAVDVALLFLAAASDGCEGTAPPTAQPLNNPQLCCTWNKCSRKTHAATCISTSTLPGKAVDQVLIVHTVLCGEQSMHVQGSCVHSNFYESLNTELGRVSAL